MASYCLMAEITANTVAKRDNIYDYIQTQLSGKPVWGNTEMNKGTGLDDSLYNMTVVVRFTQRPDLDDLFQKAKDKINTLTGVKITVSKHVCRHDESPKPCVIEELATIVR